MEMKTYLFTAQSFAGEVEMTFNDDGLLIKMDMSKATLNSVQIEFLLKRMPIHIDQIKERFADSKNLKFTPVADVEVTFDMFWDRYDEKIRSSKKRALTRWNKLTKADQQRAYQFINTYESSLQSWTQKKYAESYLNAELWNNSK